MKISETFENTKIVVFHQMFHIENKKKIAMKDRTNPIITKVNSPLATLDGL